jgi:hypothetical protein
MVFKNNYILPRVLGAHGTGAGQQETYVRARQLEDDRALFFNLGGIQGVDTITSFEHSVLEVEFDYINTKETPNKHVEGTYNGAKGALHATDDLGNGKWLSDLSGEYYIKNTAQKAQDTLDDAVAHYQRMKFTADVTLSNLDFSQNFIVTVGGNPIVLNSINWSFSIDPTQNKTKYSGVKMKSGRSSTVKHKKNMRQKQEVKNKKSRKSRDDDSQGSTPPHNDLRDNVSKEHAKICWFIDETTGDDLSIGELVKVEADGNIVDKDVKIWIDFEESRGVSFETAGTSTIFHVEKVRSDVLRANPTRS